FLSGPIERGLSLSDLGMGLRRSGLSLLEIRLRGRQRFFPLFDRRGASVHFGQGGLVRFGGGSERLLPFVEVARLAFESCLPLRQPTPSFVCPRGPVPCVVPGVPRRPSQGPPVPAGPSRQDPRAPSPGPSGRPRSPSPGLPDGAGRPPWI